jgi:hypothetical protein
VCQEDELVTAEATGSIAGTELTAESVPNCSKDLIPPIVAMEVVYSLEPIEVEENQGWPAAHG